MILLSRTEASFSGTADLVVQAGKINDAGQVALSRSETGIFFGEFYNDIAAAGEPIPTVIGFKNRFFVNDLTSDGQVAGFEQILGTLGVTGKAAIWKAAVHAQLAGLDPSIQAPYSSSLARRGDDGLGGSGDQGRRDPGLRHTGERFGRPWVTNSKPVRPCCIFLAAAGSVKLLLVDDHALANRTGAGSGPST